MKNAQAKHTPGPWEFETKGSRHFIDGNDGLTVAILDREGVRGNRSENEANSMLIASAPDLLKIALAYRNLLRVSASTEGDLATFAQIEEVIAKATGGDKK